MLEFKARCDFCDERLDDLWESGVPRNREEWGRIFPSIVQLLVDAEWLWDDLGQLACPKHMSRLHKSGVALPEDV